MVTLVQISRDGCVYINFKNVPEQDCVALHGSGRSGINLPDQYKPTPHFLCDLILDPYSLSIQLIFIQVVIYATKTDFTAPYKVIIIFYSPCGYD